MKIGDAVKRATGALGIEQCSGCARRQQWLNELGDSFARLFKGGSDEQPVQGDRVSLDNYSRPVDVSSALEHGSPGTEERSPQSLSEGTVRPETPNT